MSTSSRLLLLLSLSWWLLAEAWMPDDTTTGKNDKASAIARQAIAQARAFAPTDEAEESRSLSASHKREETFAKYREALKEAGSVAGEALLLMAGMHLDGDEELGVERDWIQALKLATESARAFGAPEAHHLLGIAYATGIFGVVEPEGEGLGELPRPIQNGVPWAHLDAGNEDLGSEGEEDDEADRESQEAGLGKQQPSGQMVAPPGRKDAVSGQEGDMEEIRAIIHEYFAAIGGDVTAVMGMGYRYLYGYGTPAECDMAVLYYEMAANYAVEEIKRRKILPYLDPMRLSDVAGVGAQSRKRRNSDQQVVEYYEHTAMKGDTAAQVELGKLYYYGRGVEQNLLKAASYFEAAARAGEPVAAGFMGHMYIMGIGVDQNNDTALAYLTQGERAQEAGSLNGLGYMYMHGMGVERSLEKATRYFHKAAHEKGHSDAFYNLGLIFAGEVTDDKDQAEDGIGPAGSRSPTTAEGMSPSSTDLAQRAQLRKKQTSSSPAPPGGEGRAGTPQMQPPPHHHLPHNHIHQQHPGLGSGKAAAAAGGGGGDPLNPEGLAGIGTRKNLQKALKYFSLAAQTGHVLALHKIGQMYSQGMATGKSCSTAVHAFKGVAERGPWVSADFNKAYQRFKMGDLGAALLYYTKLAEIGYEVAQSNAAYLLEEHHTCGKLGRIDCEKLAFRYFKHSSKQGNAEASLKVGDTYYYGKAGFAMDYEKAGKFYQAAAELRQPQAMFNLGYMHQHGIGLRQDYHLAKRYYDSAAETHPEAKWPVNLALAGLMLQWHYVGPLKAYWIKIKHSRAGSGAKEGQAAEERPTPAAAKAMAAQQPETATRPPPLLSWVVTLVSQEVGRLWNSIQNRDWWELMPAFDTVLLLVCTTVLLYIMWIRQHEGRRRRRTIQPPGQPGGDQGHQEGGR